MKKCYINCVELRARYTIKILDKISRPAESYPVLLKPPLYYGSDMTYADGEGAGMCVLYIL